PEYLAARSGAGDRESGAATRAEGHAGVRVMTVHAAKGLEFGVVAVGDLGRPLRLGWAPLRVPPGGGRGAGRVGRGRLSARAPRAPGGAARRLRGARRAGGGKGGRGGGPPG